MSANELEELQEDANAAYHQGDYGTTVGVLERVLEVRVPSGQRPLTYFTCCLLAATSATRLFDRITHVE